MNLKSQLNLLDIKETTKLLEDVTENESLLNKCIKNLVEFDTENDKTIQNDKIFYSFSNILWSDN